MKNDIGVKPKKKKLIGKFSEWEWKQIIEWKFHQFCCSQLLIKFTPKKDYFQ